MLVLDTNILIRYFTQDNEILSERALRLVNQIARDELKVLLIESVIAEIVFVLSSKNTYGLTRPEIRTHISNVLGLAGIVTDHPDVYLRALDQYVAYPRLAFVDALCAAHAMQQDEQTVLTFDQGFRNLPGIGWQDR